MRRRKVYDCFGRVCGNREAHKINWQTLAIKVNSKMVEDLYDDIKFSRITKVCAKVLPEEKELFEDEIDVHIEDVIKELEDNNVK